MSQSFKQIDTRLYNKRIIASSAYLYSKEILHHFMECGNVHSSQLEIPCKA